MLKLSAKKLKIVINTDEGSNRTDKQYPRPDGKYPIQKLQGLNKYAKRVHLKYKI